jgi:cystathionine beta-lyase/cystathionine gamma-synthase
MKIQSQVVHAGDRKRKPGQVVPATTPIHLSSTFFYESAATLDRVLGHEEEGYCYARYASPTNSALEELTTELEGGAGSLATASGMAAIQIAFQAALLDRPHSVVASHSIYGATVGFLDQILGPSGVEVSYVDICDPAKLEQVIERKKPGCVFIESISNPLLRVGDIGRIAELAHGVGAALMVDNTFATPLLMRPLEFGANMVVHSATKYLAGHGDVLGGVVISDGPHHEQIRMISRLVGPVMGPFESYLTMRGIKTLALRFERQCQNAKGVAEWLALHPCVDRVYYCSDEAHPDAEQIEKYFQPGLFGALLSFEIKGASKEEILGFMDRLKMIVPGTSLGDVHSLLLYPWIASHRNVAPKMRERMGIKENLVRIAAGIECLDDILADLDQALRSSAGVSATCA